MNVCRALIFVLKMKILSIMIRLIVHELGHAFDYVHGQNPSRDLPSSFIRPLNGEGNIIHNDTPSTNYGYAGGFASVDAWQFGYGGDRRREEFADMFVGWTYGNRFNTDRESLGPQRADHMSTHMGGYLTP
jgi:hypothetical protein